MDISFLPGVQFDYTTNLRKKEVNILRKTTIAIALFLFFAMLLPCFAACDLGGKNNETTTPGTTAAPSSDPAVTTAGTDETTVADITTAVDITTADVTIGPEATTAPEVTTAADVTTAQEVTTTPEVTTAPDVTTSLEITTAPEVTTQETPVVTEPAHTHSFSATWKSDGTNHWHECSCGEKSDITKHEFGSRTVTKPESCIAEGETECACEICGYKKTEIIEKLSHSPVFVAGTAATCLQPGKTDGSQCSVCGTILVAQETVPALGHDYAETVVPPSKDQEGYTRHDCIRCGDTYRDNYVPATGSLGLAYKNNGDGTCTITGIGTCTDEDIIVPGKIDGLTVVGIGDNAF